MIPGALRGAAIALLAMPIVGTTGTVAGASEMRTLHFEVFRRGSAIGTHRIDVSRDGDATVVRIAIELRIRAVGITLYRYTHRNRETWRNGRLATIDTETDDNGERLTVSGRATADGFVVKTRGGERTVPANVVPSSYWNAGLTRKATHMLDTQDGDLVPVTVAPRGPDRVETGAGTVDARRYKLEGPVAVDLWYEPDGHLASLAFDTRRDGSRITYRRVD